MVRTASTICLALCVLVLACAGKVGLMEPCESSSDCEDGLTCADKGDIAGLCTKPCSGATACPALTGSESTYCQTLEVFFCAQSCEADGECPTQHCKRSSSGDGLYCIP